MDILKEFLESTTIHGLYYISTCKSRIAKAGWLLVVVMGFAASTVLIHSSFSEWAKSPVATTITPHPVGDMAFPDVTICPPKGLNGALKYDLMKLANMTLSSEKKDNLILIAAQIFNDEGAKVIRDLVGERNIESLYNGFQHITKETESISIKMSSPNGTFESPFFGQNLTNQTRQELAGKRINFKLEVDTIKEMMGTEGILKLQLHVDPRVKVKVGTNAIEDLMYLSSKILSVLLY